MDSFLITDARILDGTGREPFAGSVRVEGNRITDVAAGAASPVAGPTRVIDAAGRTLMPGLIESHAHIGLADMTSYELTRLPPEEHMLVTVRNARTMLDCGYTSAFSAAAPKPRLDIVLKREIEGGRGPGPRLLANGPEITVTGGLGDSNVMHMPHYTPHGTYARDLWLFVKILGFSPMETIVAATRLGGELMGMPGELGVVRAGAMADLLLVDGDPLADIAILQDRDALRMIMKDGALHKAP
jgi:imidazolonepropionase-like amidohydrolase